MMLNNSLHYAGFLLGEIFHWRLHWNLTISSVAGGGCFTRIMAFPFFFPLGVHVQFMERFYVCVYIITISLHKIIYTKLFICYKAEVYSKEQNLHHCFFPSTLSYYIV